jgi:hypothetical protein
MRCTVGSGRSSGGRGCRAGKKRKLCLRGGTQVEDGAGSQTPQFVSSVLEWSSFTEARVIPNTPIIRNDYGLRLVVNE